VAWPADEERPGGRVALVGIDGFSPERMDRYVAEGKLPAIAAVARAGVRVPLVSTLPASTPVAWATVATGAPPSVTGIAGFLVHQPGRRLDERVSGCYSHRCRTQPIWEAATRAGKRSYVVKFPLSYPSATATFRLDGAAGWGGLRCFHEAASSAVSTLDGEAGTVRIDPDPVPWAGEAPGAPPAFRGTWRLPSLWSDGALALHAAVVEGEGGARVLVADAPDRARVLAELAEGEWSAPLTVRAPGRRGPVECSFRVKALACGARPPRLRLLNTTVHERTGHAAPEEVWLRHLDEAGPIEEQTEPSLVFHAGLDAATQMEVFRLNAEWLERACTALLRDEPWDLFMVQIHLVDWAHHLLHGGVDPRHPAFDPAAAPALEEMLLEAYRMADRLVAAVARAAGPDANLVVMGDHGQDVQHTTFHVNEWLAAEGWLAWAGEGDAVDWDRTRVYATGNYLHFNRLGREPTGIVDPAGCERLAGEVTARLLALTDPRTGERVVRVAGERREFELLGADGAEAGDLVFCLCSGYGATNGRGPLLKPTVPLREFTSGHDHFWPLDPRIHTRLFAAGPAFRTGVRRPRAAQLVDVAPTLAAVLGIDPPAHSEGRVLADLLAPGVAPGSPAAARPAVLASLEVL
jgi:predicted AlkP superfamily phosphohydrolase/phosphomutase